VVLKPRADDYERALPTPADVHLLVEVADSSLAFDLNTKLPLYGAAGIPEVWIVDLSARRVECHAGPEQGLFTRRRVVSEGGLAPEQLADCQLTHGDLFR